MLEFVEWLSRRITTRLRSVAWNHARAAETGADVSREHEDVLTAIRSRDPAAVGEMARRHFERAVERLSRRGDLVD
jgi:DNA-binding GntR family transcriptional regulator